MIPEAYFIAKWVHILSSTVLFGTGMGTAFFFWSAHLRGEISGIAAVASIVVRADWLFTLTSGLVQPLSGIALIMLAGHDPWAPWLLLTYALYAIALICWLPVVWLQIKLRDFAIAAQASCQPLPEKYNRYARLWFILGWPAFVGLMLVFWLMVTKTLPW
jgi:uncharacterized membrane protein